MNGPLWPDVLALAGLCLGWTLLAVLKTAFRGLSPVAAQEIVRREELGEKAFLRKSIHSPTPLWFTLQISSLTCLVAIAVVLALAASGSRALGPWTAALLGVGVAVILMIAVEFLLAGILVKGREEGVIVALLGPLRLLHLLLYPVSELLARTGNWGGWGGKLPGEDRGDPEEIRAYIEVGEREGILEEEEKVLIKGVVEFGDTVAREVMTPRTDVIAVPVGTRLGELRHIMAEAMHTRLPVYESQVDNIVGVVHLKDLVKALDEGREAEVVDGILRPTYFAPENMKVHDLMRLFQAKRLTMAIVVDEYGGTAGIVTMEDLVEEIVGEIQDEHETGEAWIVRERNGAFAVDGRVALDDLSEVLGRNMTYDEAETVGGLVLSRLGHMPGEGESVEIDDFRFHVLRADEKRVYRLRIEPTTVSPATRSEGAGNDPRSPEVN